MKRLKTLLLLLFLSLPLFALDCNLSLGYQEKYTNYHKHDPLCVEINVWQDINNLRLYGNYTNEMHRNEYVNWQFWPSQDYFTVGTSYNFSIFEVKVEHMCYHPVVAWGQEHGINGSYTKVEVTIGDKF